MKTKYIFLVVSASIILLVTFFTIQSNSISRFKKNAQETVNILRFTAFDALLITDKYTKIWSDYIKYEKRGMLYVDGEERYFGHFTKAVDYRVKEQRDKGKLADIEKKMSTAKELVQTIDNSWFGNNEAKKMIRELYLSVGKCHSMATTPIGSFNSYSMGRVKLLNDISSQLKELELYFPESKL